MVKYANVHLDKEQEKEAIYLSYSSLQSSELERTLGALVLNLQNWGYITTYCES